MLTVGDIIKRTQSWLESRGCESARMDAELLVGQALQMKRLQVFMNLGRGLSEPEVAAIRALVRRRGEREPIAYILGEREFWSMAFGVGPGVLIPRPDTETLVRAALPYCDGDEVFVADVCAGSGCVGLALAREKPGIKLFATDLSDAALRACAANVERHGMRGRVAVLKGDLLAPIPEGRPLDVIVANPPYIRSAEIPELQAEVSRWEPAEALDGGTDGLEIYRRLIPAAAARARRAVLVEIGHDQGPAVAALFREAGLLDVQILKDYGRRDRVVSGSATGWSRAGADAGDVTVELDEARPSFDPSAETVLELDPLQREADDADEVRAPPHAAAPDEVERIVELDEERPAFDPSAALTVEMDPDADDGPVVPDPEQEIEPEF